jgi:hypothetical protein
MEGKECLAGMGLYFKVSHEYALDIDETVWLDADLYLESAEVKLSVGYDKNDLVDDVHAATQIRLPGRTTSNWQRISIPLERARFAKLGPEGEDFSIFFDCKRSGKHVFSGAAN